MESKCYICNNTDINIIRSKPGLGSLAEVACASCRIYLLSSEAQTILTLFKNVDAFSDMEVQKLLNWVESNPGQTITPKILDELYPEKMNKIKQCFDYEPAIND
jgi:excinuclease UvrABC ATPase subunit